jgi:hypothetical protein
MRPTKHALDAADSTAPTASIFLRLIISPIGRREAVRPSAMLRERKPLGGKECEYKHEKDQLASFLYCYINHPSQYTICLPTGKWKFTYSNGNSYS